MIPLAVLLLALSIVIMLAHSSIIGPFIYTLF